MPIAQLAVVVHPPHPTPRHGLLLPVLLGAEAFHFQDDFYLLPVPATAPNEIVRPIPMSEALLFIGDGEVQVVVAGIGNHFRHPLRRSHRGASSAPGLM
jgi:hypothetical protein